GFYYTYAALGIATAILTMFTLPVMWFLSEKRKGSVIGMSVVDISWVWFLWIMWLSTAGSSAGWLGSCGWYGSDGSFETACRSSQALSAFAFLNWLILMFYNFTLFAFAIRQHMRGNTGIWKTQIAEADWTAAGNNTVYTGQEFKGQAQPGFAPQYPPSTGVSPGGYAPQGQYPQQGYAPAPGTPQTTGTSPYPQV
ncbi:hypothetical protein BJ165DRAFT_1350519, partial [Panaeolus papilionaceus]